jgi:hypothetical protein
LVRKLLYYQTTHNFVSFRERVGFSLKVCSHAKLVRQLFVSLLHLFCLSVILLHFNTATSVKHSRSKVRGISLKLCRISCLFSSCGRNLTNSYSCCIFAPSIYMHMKEFRATHACSSSVSFHIYCFGACKMLLNNNRIGISASVPGFIALPIRCIALGYAIHLSGIELNSLVAR